MLGNGGGSIARQRVLADVRRHIAPQIQVALMLFDGASLRQVVAGCVEKCWENFALHIRHCFC